MNSTSGILLVLAIAVFVAGAATAFVPMPGWARAGLLRAPPLVALLGYEAVKPERGCQADCEGNGYAVSCAKMRE